MSKHPASPPPAYFLSLSLENVRSFGDKQTISFARKDGRPAQWTIILGDNGVGKTTVLKALAGSVPLGEFNLEEEFPQAFTNNVFIFKWLPFRNGVNRSIIAYKSSLDRYLVDEKGKLVAEEAALEIIDTNISKYPVIGHAMPAKDISNLICYGYGAGRTVGNSTITAPQDLLEDSVVSLFDDRADLLNPEEWFLQLDYSSLREKGGRAARILEQVRQALLLVLPDVEDIQIKSTEKHQQQLELLTPYGWVRLRDMSLGYQTLVVWLTDFASKLFIRYPDSPNPLEEPAIVLIDEIDLHLHPSWQRKLIGFLSGIFKNTQFIATAHSPLVVQAAGDAGANVVLLKREGDQTIVRQSPEDVQGWRIDQILTSELFGLETARSLQTEEKLARRAELLTKRKRTANETKELKKLTAELNAEPLGETPSERDVNAVLQELRRRLQPKDSDSAAV